MERGASSYWTYSDTRLSQFEDWAHAEVLVADSRLDQGGIRAAVDAVFDANPTLGAVFESSYDCWLSRPGGCWSWAVEPPGVAASEVIARHRASYDMFTGRLFAVSLLPGTPDRLVLTASHLCVDGAEWRSVVDSLSSTYTENEGVLLAPEGAYRI